MFDVIVVDFRLGYYCIRYRRVSTGYMPCYMVICEKGHSSRVTTRAGARRAARARAAQRDVGPGPTRNTALTDGTLRKGQLIDSRSSRAHTVSARSGALIKTLAEDALRLAHYGCP